MNRHRRRLVALALAAPFLLTFPQQWLIPSWYERSLYLTGVALLLHLIVVVLVVVWLVRRSRWRWPARLGAAVALVGIAAVAAFATWAVGVREGVFLCGRELDAVVTCADGGQAFEFTWMCIAGNPKTDVQVRPGLLPFMYPVSAESAKEACRAVPR